jgi:hypothetical protein
MIVVIEKLAYPVSLRSNDLGADLDVSGARQPLNFIAGIREVSSAGSATLLFCPFYPSPTSLGKKIG